MVIIGLYGFISSGKGTVADILVDEHGFHREAFANPVKDAVSAIFDWPRHLLEGDTKESREFRETPCPIWSALMLKPFSPRMALQLMGTEAGRDVFHEDLWLYALGKRLGVYGAWQQIDKIVISDVRFPNEIDFIRKLGGRAVRVRRGPEPDFWDTALRDNTTAKMDVPHMSIYYPDIHYSEWAWIGKEPDYLIENNSTIEDLSDQINDIVKSMKGDI